MSGTLARHMGRTGAVLALFAVVGTGLVAFTYLRTKPPIEASQRQAFLESIDAILPHALYDNALYSDVVRVSSPELLGSDELVPVYRARKNGRPAAVVLAPIAPDGYSGKIHLLMAIAHDGTVLGVRVTNHKETPGLGDPIEIERSPWITGFNGKTLDNPSASGWNVRKDGGVFDQFAGATITPRAVVKAVHNALKYYATHRDELFAPVAAETLPHE